MAGLESLFVIVQAVSFFARVLQMYDMYTLRSQIEFAQSLR